MAGLWLEQLEVGLVVEHQIRRTVTEADNMLFSTMTMNPQPLHLDAEFAATTEFGQILVNSMFTLGLVVGLSVHELTLGTTVANLGFGSISFPAPVFIGDTIRAESEVITVRASSSRPGQGIATFEHRGYKQGGVLVVRAERQALILRRPAAT
ncbi:MAG: dehydratase [Ilumatobacteraceae bacterium]|nr:dehydratase [Ilumatobacteraceae bacterium]